MIDLSPAGNDTGCQVQDSLNGGQITGSTVPIHREAVSDVRNDQVGCDVRKGFSRKEMTEVGTGNKDASCHSTYARGYEYERPRKDADQR